MKWNDPQLWTTVSQIVIAISFVVMAFSLLGIALIVRKVVKTVNRMEQRVEPLIDQVNEISSQGKDVAVQFNELSGHLAVASKNFSDSTGLIKEEVAELKLLVGQTADVAKDKVELVNQTIDRTQLQVTDTADFIQAKVVQPAAEIAAIMAGVKKGLEVLFAPSPKRIDRAYQEDELFIG